MTPAENILSTIEAALLSAGLSASVERDRTTPFQIDELPGVVIKPKHEESVPWGNRNLRSTLIVEIEVNVRGAVPSTLADPITEKIDAALIANQSLAGLIAKLFRSGKEWEFSDSDGTGVKLVITYQIHHIEPA
ncbi:MAG: hypothetical protein P4L87_25180 [Formivibrio sp.]|nr:hypothetical protein [Formivibrio sp.]